MMIARVCSGFANGVFIVLVEKVMNETIPDYPFMHSDKMLCWIGISLGIASNALLGYFFE